MGPEAKREAMAIKRILDAETREIVGWLFEWNNGVQAPFWKNGPKANIIYE